MLDISKLISISESAGQCFNNFENGDDYSNISLDEAVMIGKIQNLESIITYHNIIDEDANACLGIYLNQITGNIITEAADNEKRSGFVGFMSKIKNWIVDKFNRFIQWLRGLIAKIKNLFGKKTDKSDEAINTLENAQSKVATVVKQSPEAATAVKTAEKEITVNMHYVDGYAIKSLIGLSSFAKLMNDMASEVDYSTMVDYLNEVSKKEMEDFVDETKEWTKEAFDEQYAEMYKDAMDDVSVCYSFANKPEDAKTLIDDLSKKRVTKSYTLTELGIDPINDNLREKFPTVISKLSNAKCEITFKENRVTPVINAYNKIINWCETAKKEYTQLVDKIVETARSKDIPESALSNVRKGSNNMVQAMNTVVSFCQTFCGLTVQILNGYMDSYASAIAACSAAISKANTKS